MNEPDDKPPLGASTAIPAALSLDEALALGVRLQKTGRLPEAEQVYRAILAAVPDHVEALHFLGLVLFQAGLDAEGAELIERVATRCPDYADAQSNLGNVRRAQGRLADAAAAYGRAIALAPHHAQAHNNLGVVLKDLGRLEEAMAAFREAIALDSRRADAHFNLANLLEREGQTDEAIMEYQRAIELEPLLVNAYDSLARGLWAKGRAAEAIALLQRLREKMPDNPVASHMLAALTGQDVPARASAGYVQQIFDVFADNFDRVLERLGYQAPALVAEAIAREGGAPAGRWDVLDAGCGTGLCGPLLKPYARRLVGVDLSARMLAKASDRGFYNELVQAELTQFLHDHASAYDLVASADTLVYFGELGGILTATAKALRTGGLLVFTLEEGGETVPQQGFRLQEHGRYCHSEAYVRTTLAQAGAEVCAIMRAVLRKESGRSVAGLTVAARRA
jgi:predicted TPR repeat methyltransferase